MVEMRLLKIHLDRLADIDETDVENLNIEGWTASIPAASGVSILLRDVGFRHPSSEEWLFRGLTLEIPSGSCLLVDGPSGTGKTTLLKIILGLNSPTEGEVIIDGVPISKWNTASFRGLMATVMQDDCVVAGTIRDNISFFNENVSPEQVVAAAVAANIDAEIQRLPMGYATRISDLDGTLSGGQRQRILLARALCRSARLLVLDEAFSHLDLENRRQIGKCIAGLGMTRVVVSHTEHEHYMPDRTISIEELARHRAEFESHVPLSA